MISGKDVRIESGYIIINGEKYPIVQDVSDIEGDVEDLDDRVTALEEVSGVISLNTDGGWRFEIADNNTVKKQGKIAWLSSYIYNENDLTPNAVYEVGTLPAAFIPSKEFKVPIYQGANEGILRGILNIRATGKIDYRSVDGSKFAIYTTIIYPLD